MSNFHLLKGQGVYRNGEMVSPASIRLSDGKWVQPTETRPYPEHQTTIDFVLWPDGETEVKWRAVRVLECGSFFQVIDSMVRPG